MSNLRVGASIRAQRVKPVTLGDRARREGLQAIVKRGAYVRTLQQRRRELTASAAYVFGGQLQV